MLYYAVKRDEGTHTHTRTTRVHTHMHACMALLRVHDALMRTRVPMHTHTHTHAHTCGSKGYTKRRQAHALLIGNLTQPQATAIALSLANAWFFINIGHCCCCVLLHDSPHVGDKPHCYDGIWLRITKPLAPLRICNGTTRRPDKHWTLTLARLREIAEQVDVRAMSRMQRFHLC